MNLTRFCLPIAVLLAAPVSAAPFPEGTWEFNGNGRKGELVLTADRGSGHLVRLEGTVYGQPVVGTYDRRIRRVNLLRLIRPGDPTSFQSIQGYLFKQGKDSALERVMAGTLGPIGPRGTADEMLEAGWSAVLRQAAGDAMAAAFGLDDGLVVAIPVGEAEGAGGRMASEFSATGVRKVVDRWGWPEAAYRFDGEEGRLALSPDAVPPSDQYTIAAWVKAANDHWAYLVHFCRPEPRSELSISLLPNRSVAVGDGKSRRLTSQGRFDAGAWRHLAVTVDARDPERATYAIYIDGELDSTRVAPYDPNGRMRACNVGSFGSSKRMFRGVLDEVCVYRRALGAEQVRQLAWHPGPVRRRAGQDRAVLSDHETARAWSDLADPDGRRAESALLALVAGGEPALRFIESRVRPDADGLEAKVREHVAQLGVEGYPARERATRELLRLGPAVVPVLERLGGDHEPTEAAIRIEQIITRLEGVADDAFGREADRRLLRTVSLLEQIGSPEADRLIGWIRDDARRTSRSAIASCATAALARRDRR